MEYMHLKKKKLLYMNYNQQNGNAVQHDSLNTHPVRTYIRLDIFYRSWRSN